MRISLLVHLLLISSFYFNPAHKENAQAAPLDTLAKCTSMDLKLGPIVEVTAEEKINLSSNPNRLKILSGDRLYQYDLDRGGSAELKEKLRFSNTSGQREAAITKPNLLDTTHDFSSPEHFAGLTHINSPNGRPVSVSRLYSNNYLIKVSDTDQSTYQHFSDDLRQGLLCGARIETLPLQTRRKITTNVIYFLFDEMTSGRIANYQDWLHYKPIFDIFLTKIQIEEFLEVYAYRTAENSGLNNELPRIDPSKLWAFTWNQAAKLFNHKDATEFTDLSAYQNGDKISFMILGSQPIANGKVNRYGFYTRQEESLAVSPLQGQRAFSWQWLQGTKNYTAEVTLSQKHPPGASKPSQFPLHAAHGLIFLDATMIKSDVDELTKSYQDYYKQLGFEFGPQTPINNIPKFFAIELAQNKVDYLIRDGHSDGDDENVIVLYPDGYMKEGKRNGPQGPETVKLIYNLKKEPANVRIAYSTFNDLLHQRAKHMPTALTLVDGSCWGFEKTRFTLGEIDPSLVIAISANTPVNFFENTDINAMRRLLDAIRNGKSFT